MDTIFLSHWNLNKMKVYLKEPCTCGSKFGKFETTHVHQKLLCAECDKYIKFVGKNDHFRRVTDEPDMDLLQEINFKLDLLLDHLEIRNASKS